MSLPVNLSLGQLPKSHLAAEQLHAITINAKSHRKSCSEAMRLIVAFGQSKTNLEDSPFELQYGLANCYMPRGGNVGMANLPRLGEGHHFEVKYLAEDFYQFLKKIAIPTPSIATHLMKSVPN